MRAFIAVLFLACVSAFAGIQTGPNSSSGGGGGNATNGTIGVDSPAYFGDLLNNTIADSSTFPASVFNGQFLMTWDNGIGGDSGGQLFVSGAGGGWRRELQLGRVTILETNSGNGEGLLVKTTNGTDNVITIQNMAADHFSAMRWIGKSGSERGAVGYGNTNAPFYADVDYLEDTANTAGFYFASRGFVNGGLERGTHNFIWCDGQSGTNDTTAAVVARISTNGIMTLNGGITGNNAALKLTRTSGNDALSFNGQIAMGYDSKGFYLGDTGNFIFHAGGGSSGANALELFNGIGLTFNADGGADIGQSAAKRPNNVYVKNNVVAGGIILGASTNTALGTAVNTNWVGGLLYTNTTGRPIMVMGNAVLTTAAVAGFSQLALQCSGTGTNYATVISAVAGLTGAMTNAMSPLIVPNGSVFTWTNTSSGAGDNSSPFGGQYVVW